MQLTTNQQQPARHKLQGMQVTTHQGTNFAGPEKVTKAQAPRYTSNRQPPTYQPPRHTRTHQPAKHKLQGVQVTTSNQYQPRHKLQGTNHQGMQVTTTKHTNQDTTKNSRKNKKYNKER